MLFEFPLPSGLIIEASELYGRDTVQIAERVGGNASGDTIAAFMTACTKRVIDPGPYPWLEPGDGSPPWKRLLWGDLLYALIKLRVESFPEYRGRFEFEFSCPECRALTPGEIDLEALLADEDHFQHLPEASRDRMLRSEFFQVKMPTTGKVVTFDLAKAEQDEPMKVLMRRNKRTKETDVERIAKRLKSVEGLVSSKGEPVRDLAALWRWAHGLNQYEIDFLLAEMGAADILVDMRILAWCRSTDTNCGRQSRIPLPLDIAFFRPRSATKRVSTEKDAASPGSSPG